MKKNPRGEQPRGYIGRGAVRLLAVSLGSFALSGLAIAQDKVDPPKAAAAPTTAPLAPKPAPNATGPNGASPRVLEGPKKTPPEMLAPGEGGRKRGLYKPGEGPPDGSTERGMPGDGMKPGGPSAVLQRRHAVKDYREALEAIRAAQAAEKAGDKAAKEELEKAREAAMAAYRKARGDMRAAHRKEARKFLEQKSLPEIRTKLKERSDKMLTDRKERADKHREKIKKEVGAKAAEPQVRAELIRHAWRVARLTRLIDIAEAAGNESLAERAKDLLTMETEHHSKRLPLALAGKLEKAPDAAKAKEAKKPALKPVGESKPSALVPKTVEGAQ